MTIRGKTEWQKLVDEKLKDHEKRLGDYEKEQAVYKALAEEQRRHINERFNRVQDNVTQTKADLTKDLTSIKSGINKVTWLIVAVFIAGVAQFVLKGGLNI